MQPVPAPLLSLALGVPTTGIFYPQRIWRSWNLLPATSASPYRTPSSTARLEDKISEFERLKEFHENIVESINIGIFAVDLEGRIGSWNTQMETMYGTRRIAEALGQPLSAIFPDRLRSRA